MKAIFSLSIIAAAAIMTVVACTGKKEQKTLVLYYSQTGTTKFVAEEIQRLTGADIEALDVEVPYDGTYDETIQRFLKEREDGIMPVVKPLSVNLEDYDVIYLGYPIWFGTYASPIASLVKAQDFAGKKIIPFCSFGSGGLEASVNDLKSALPNAEIAEGYGVRTARITAIPAEVDRFLKENKYIKGKVESLPEYTEQQPVTDDEIAIFDAACGNYQFPLGTPVTFGVRETSNSTDYKFIVKGQGMNGTPVTTTIFVTVSNEDGAKPEFTKVVR